MAVDILQVDENKPRININKRQASPRINPLIHELNKNLPTIILLLQHKLQQHIKKSLTTYVELLIMEIKEIQISVIIIEYRYRS